MDSAWIHSGTSANTEVVMKSSQGDTCNNTVATPMRTAELFQCGATRPCSVCGRMVAAANMGRHNSYARRAKWGCAKHLTDSKVPTN